MPPRVEPAAVNVPTAEAGEARPAPARRRRAHALIILCCTLVAAALVAGAAGTRPVDDDSVLRGFQIRVLSISQAAAENRLDGALTALQALEKDLGDAAGAGRLSAARYRGIETALSAVKSDIAGQVAAAASLALQEPDAGASGLADPVQPAVVAQSEPAPAAPAVPAVAPATAPDVKGPGSQRSDTAKEAKDKNKGKGQGKP